MMPGVGFEEMILLVLVAIIVIGPKDLPPAIVQSLYEAFNEANNDPATLELLGRYIQVPWKRNPTEYRAFAYLQTGRTQAAALLKLRNIAANYVTSKLCFMASLLWLAG